MATDRHQTTTGHLFSQGEWLDAHFEACLPEYTQALQSAGLQPGWHVLDAGCGSGSFVPLIAEELGPDGHITALDLAPENVKLVRERARTDWSVTTSVEAAIGSVLDLDFPDDTFDAVWCANVQEYLPDDDLLSMLSEFRRVTRPGGLVVIKDVDPLHFIVHPAPLLFFQHHWEAAFRRPDWTPVRAAVRTWELEPLHGTGRT